MSELGRLDGESSTSDNYVEIVNLCKVVDKISRRFEMNTRLQVVGKCTLNVHFDLLNEMHPCFVYSRLQC